MRKNLSKKWKNLKNRSNANYQIAIIAFIEKFWSFKLKTIFRYDNQLNNQFVYIQTFVSRANIANIYRDKKNLFIVKQILFDYMFEFFIINDEKKFAFVIIENKLNNAWKSCIN